MVRMIENLEEFKKVLRESDGKLVVVDFTASWCGPCQRIAPNFVELSNDPANKDVVFLKVDVDDAADVAEHYKISSMPTFKFFKNGVEVGGFSGADLNTLKSTIQKLK